jgi:hypothetical protein
LVVAVIDTRTPSLLVLASKLCDAIIGLCPSATSVCVVQIVASLALTIKCCLFAVDLETGAEEENNVAALVDLEGTRSVKEEKWSLTFIFIGNDQTNEVFFISASHKFLY